MLVCFFPSIKFGYVATVFKPTQFVLRLIPNLARCGNCCCRLNYGSLDSATNSSAVRFCQVGRPLAIVGNRVVLQCAKMHLSIGLIRILVWWWSTFKRAVFVSVFCVGYLSDSCRRGASTGGEGRMWVSWMESESWSWYSEDADKKCGSEICSIIYHLASRIHNSGKVVLDPNGRFSVFLHR